MAPGYPKGADPAFAPARFKKELLKLLKAITPDSGVLLIGCATRVFGREKALLELFKDGLHVMVGLPSYAQRRLLISRTLERAGLPEFGDRGVAQALRCVRPERRAS